MEVDEVFERIGEFGPAQVKLFFVLTLPGMWMALHGLVPNFIGTDPGWNCSIGSPTGVRHVSPMANRVTGCPNYIRDIMKKRPNIH